MRQSIELFNSEISVVITLSRRFAEGFRSDDSARFRRPFLYPWIFQFEFCKDMTAPVNSGYNLSTYKADASQN